SKMTVDDTKGIYDYGSRVIRNYPPETTNPVENATYWYVINATNTTGEEITDYQAMTIYPLQVLVGTEETSATDAATYLDNPIETPSSPATYVYQQTYQFNITTSSNADKNHVYLEINTTGTQTNYTASNDTGLNFSYTFTDLAAGIYVYRWYANSTDNTWNSTSETTYLVNKASSSTAVTFSPSASEVYGTTTSAVLSITAGDPTAGTLLLRNGTNVGASSETILLAAGIYNYTSVYNESENFTASENRDNILTITKAPTSITLYLNGSLMSDTSKAYGNITSVNATLNVSYTATLERNGTATSNPESIKLAAGIYNYTGYWDGNENYSSSSLTKHLTITRIPSTIIIGFNLTSPQKYGNITEVWGNITIGDPTAAVSIYRNGTNVAGGSGNQSVAELLGVGIYNFTVVYNESENYTSSSDQDNFTITKASSDVDLWINGTKGSVSFDENSVEFTNLSCQLISPSLAEVINLTTNRTGWTYYNRSSPFSNITSFLAMHQGGVGIYNITVSWLGNENYSASSETHYLTVTSAGDTGASGGGGGSGTTSRLCLGDELEVTPLIIFSPLKEKSYNITIKNLFDKTAVVNIEPSESIKQITTLSDAGIIIYPCEEKVIYATFEPIEDVDGTLEITSNLQNKSIAVHIKKDYERYVFVSNSTTTFVYTPEEWGAQINGFFLTKIFALPKPIGPIDGLYVWMLVALGIIVGFYYIFVKTP
ncbi:MAG: hypothetical protein ACTSUF_05410, partial [Candidatus Heimdallarchaeaceae archaeon]